MASLVSSFGCWGRPRSFLPPSFAVTRPGSALLEERSLVDLQTFDRLGLLRSTAEITGWKTFPLDVHACKSIDLLGDQDGV